MVTVPSQLMDTDASAFRVPDPVTDRTNLVKGLLENRDIVISARSDTAEIVSAVGSNRNRLALVINISTSRATADNDSPSQT